MLYRTNAYYRPLSPHYASSLHHTHAQVPSHNICSTWSGSNSYQAPLGIHTMIPTAHVLSSPYQSAPKIDVSHAICSVYSMGHPDACLFRCHDSKCQDKTFSRWYDFKRHYNGAHATTPIVYWCEVEGCVRSKAVGNRPFPRKDKLDNHVEKMHG